MKKTLFFIFAALIFIGCNNGNKEAVSKYPTDIESLEQLLIASTDAKQTDTITHLLIKAMREKIKQDTDAGDIMHDMYKVASLYYSIGDFKQAIDVCENILKAYPVGELVPQVLFFEGVIYQLDLQMYGKAKSVFDRLIAQFPSTAEAESARAMVENMGLTEDELIKKFESQNKDVIAADNSAN